MAGEGPKWPCRHAAGPYPEADTPVRPHPLDGADDALEEDRTLEEQEEGRWREDHEGRGQTWDPIEAPVQRRAAPNAEDAVKEA